MILIIGAGLAGLSTAYHLGSGRDYQVCEKEQEAGGLCRSYSQKGFILITPDTCFIPGRTTPDSCWKYSCPAGYSLKDGEHPSMLRQAHYPMQPLFTLKYRPWTAYHNQAVIDDVL